MSVWKCEAVLPSLPGRLFSQQNDLPPSLKDCSSLCQTHCCLIVTSSDSLLLALRQSERSQSLCAGDIKACLSERRIGKGGGGGVGRGFVEQLYLLCSCLQLYLLGLFVCCSSSWGKVEGTMCGSHQNHNT